MKYTYGKISPLPWQTSANFPSEYISTSWFGLGHQGIQMLQKWVVYFLFYNLCMCLYVRLRKCRMLLDCPRSSFSKSILVYEISFLEARYQGETTLSYFNVSFVLHLNRILVFFLRQHKYPNNLFRKHPHNVTTKLERRKYLISQLFYFSRKP